MERLTYFKDGHWRLDFGGVQYQADFVDRLADYENSSLSPTGAAKAAEIEEELSEYGYSIERMVELMCADKEGRVIVLPCKAGDTVYYLSFADEAVEATAMTDVNVSTACRVVVKRSGLELTLPASLLHKTREEALAELEGKA